METNERPCRKKQQQKTEEERQHTGNSIRPVHRSHFAAESWPSAPYPRQKTQSPWSFSNVDRHLSS